MNLFFLVFIFSLLFSLFFKKIVKIINIFDAPDGVRKFQKKKISCIGGIYFYFVFIVLLFYCFFISKETNYIFQIFLIENNKEFILFFLTATSLFLIGLYDDKYQLDSTIKTVLLLTIIFFYVYHENKFQINEIRSSLLSQNIQLGNLSIFFTSICIFSLLVASNMFDGSNGQSFINFSSIFIFLFYQGLFIELSYLFVLMLIFFAFYNFKNLAYLGDNGIYFLSFILGYLIIKNYNFDKTIYAEEIIIILLIPILDMVRLFITRTILGKNPFMPDATHLHHIIQKKYGAEKLIYILIILFFVPLLILIFSSFEHFYIIFLQFFVYVYLILNNKFIKFS
tara:strand:+ start:1736 stop:2752 length:1017 start_codon:yes stop_codon:yes gene_type:complete